MTNPLDYASDVSNAALISALMAEAGRLGIAWELRTGTVVNGATRSRVIVIDDSDSTSVQTPMFSMVGNLLVGQRVYILKIAPAGQYVVGIITGPTYRLVESLYFTASSTFNKADYAGISAVAMEGVGPGGGSGGCAATIAGQCAASAGGGAGGYARKLFLIDDLSVSETVTVGSGSGTAGPSGNNAGTTGTSTVFSSVTCPGGTGGGGSAASATYVRVVSGVGGTPTGGDLNILGGDGGFGIRGGGEVMSVGFGGASLLGGSTRAGNTGGATSGRAYGGGAGGGYSDASTGARAGANGADGIVILHLYI